MNSRLTSQGQNKRGAQPDAVPSIDTVQRQLSKCRHSQAHNSCNYTETRLMHCIQEQGFSTDSQANRCVCTVPLLCCPEFSGQRGRVMPHVWLISFWKQADCSAYDGPAIQYSNHLPVHVCIGLTRETHVLIAKMERNCNRTQVWWNLYLR